ncbi:MAG: Ni/Fe hydrogenase subunit alpha [Chitinivibrionales bacterium]|nr:Ni/Fe hydrogenase subunit alpha [Chitinivibrionales bacterium]
MGRTLAINPVTRIEGHARVNLEIDDAKTITGSCFQVMDFRGFETFLQGMQVEMMPAITPRICGTCPQTHHLVAARAVDKVYQAAIPRPAWLQRAILNAGGIIHSHAIHFFMLAGPDLLFGLDSDPAQRNIVGIAQAHPDKAKMAIRLRAIGHKICEEVGGRGTHPVTQIAGGAAAPLEADKIATLKQYAQEALALCKELYEFATSILEGNTDLVQSLPLETAYLGTVKGGVFDLYDGDLRLTGADGTFFEFSEDAWTDHIVEGVTDGSYGKPTVFKTGSESIAYRVGPLARMNCAESIDTPLANGELAKFKHNYGSPCHQTVLYNQARLIELLYSVEKLNELINDPELASDNIRARLGTPRNAAAHVEAPRGVLIHDYQVDENAIVTKANLLVATQQNLGAINETIKMSAQKFIDQKDELLLNAVEFAIRCYDPCLSCATHRIGQMKMQVTITHNGSAIRHLRRS